MASSGTTTTVSRQHTASQRLQCNFATSSPIRSFCARAKRVLSVVFLHVAARLFLAVAPAKHLAPLLLGAELVRMHGAVGIDPEARPLLPILPQMSFQSPTWLRARQLDTFMIHAELRWREVSASSIGPRTPLLAKAAALPRAASACMSSPAFRQCPLLSRTPGCPRQSCRAQAFCRGPTHRLYVQTVG